MMNSVPMELQLPKMASRRVVKRKLNMEDSSSPVPRTKRSLSPGKKEEAVKRVRNGETKAHVARCYGVPESTLRGWYKKAVQSKSPDMGGANQTTTEASNLSGSAELKKRLKSSSEQQNSRSSRSMNGYNGVYGHNGTLDLSFPNPTTTSVNAATTSRTQFPNINQATTSRAGVSRSDTLHSELSASASYPMSSRSHMSGLSSMRTGGHLDTLYSTLYPSMSNGNNLKNIFQNIRPTNLTQLGLLQNKTESYMATLLKFYPDGQLPDELWNAFHLLNPTAFAINQSMLSSLAAASRSNGTNGIYTIPNSTATSPQETATNPNITGTSPNITATNLGTTATTPVIPVTSPDVTATNLSTTPTSPNITATDLSVTSLSPNVTATNLSITPTSPNITATSPNITATEPNVTATDLSITSTSPNIALDSRLRSPTGEEEPTTPPSSSSSPSIHPPSTSNILYAELTRERNDTDIQIENLHARTTTNARSPNNRPALDTIVNNNNDINVMSNEETTVTDEQELELLMNVKKVEDVVEYFKRNSNPRVTHGLITALTSTVSNIRDDMEREKCPIKRIKQRRK